MYLEIKEKQWLCMAGYHNHVPDFNAGYFNKCMDKEDNPISHKTYTKPPAQARSRLIVKKERAVLEALIKEGKSNNEVYRSIVELGYFVNSEGEQMTKRTLLPIVSKIRAKNNIPNKPNIKSRVADLIKQKKTIDEIKSAVDLNSEQIVNVFSRLRIKLSAYRRGKLVYLK